MGEAEGAGAGVLTLDLGGRHLQSICIFVPTPLLHRHRPQGRAQRWEERWAQGRAQRWEERWAQWRAQRWEERWAQGRAQRWAQGWVQGLP